MAGKDEETSLEDSSFGPGHFTPPHCEHPVGSSQYKEVSINLYKKIIHF